MNLPNFCIKRPAFTIVISLVMTIIGLIGFTNLPVRWIPNVIPPVVTISTLYPGANAALVEKDVTKVLEDSLSGIAGMQTLQSTSKQNMSQITVTFNLGRNMDSAAEDIRSSIERVRDTLPQEVKSPSVTKSDSNNDAILYIAIYNDKWSSVELSDYVNKYIMPTFETTDGVGSVLLLGSHIPATRIWLDPARMAAANVTPDEVARLLQNQNLSVPSGQIRGKDRYYSIMTDASLTSPEQFNSLIIRDDHNQIVRLKDIGTAESGTTDEESSFRIMSKPAVALAIFGQSNTNPLDVEKNVQQSLTELQRGLPTGMKMRIVFNQADYIRASIKSVYESLFEAALFVWIVIFAFLCNFRATLIPIITIPVCLISTFAILYALGFSINVITLMAFVLAIGLVVDDAIVMLENITRHIESGMSPYKAAVIGSREMIFPIIAMTLTLAAVYAPIAFTPGLLGVLFREFTFSLAGAVIISGIVGLTLSPMMCSKLLRPTENTSRYSIWFQKQLSVIQSFYKKILSLVLMNRKWVVLGLIIVGIIGYSVYKNLPIELAPQEDTGEIYAYMSAPRGASFQYTDANVRQLELIYQSMPDLKSYFSEVGVFTGSGHSFQMLTLKPKGKRTQSYNNIITELNDKTSNVTGVRTNIFAPPPPLAQAVDSDMGDGTGMVIMTTRDYRDLQKVSQKIVDELRQDPQFLTVYNRLKWDGEQFQVTINREQVADLRVPFENIANTISILLGGRTIGKSNDQDVILQMNAIDLSNPNILSQLYTRNDDGKMIPLSQLLSVQVNTSPESYSHYERLRADTIYVNLAPNTNMGEAIKKLNQVAKENLPDDMKYTYVGEAKSFLESNNKMTLTFMLAIVFIYLVLVAQFESFIDPLVILLTVPFAMVGAMLTLKLFGGSLNIYSDIGLITLIGLIAKHGILITEFANRLRGEGQSIHDAIFASCLLRLRPILMTTAAMILGALPLALAFGSGAETRQQIGMVIIGGLFFGTFFSLIVVPIMYTFLAPYRKINTTEPA